MGYCLVIWLRPFGDFGGLRWLVCCDCSVIALLD